MIYNFIKIAFRDIRKQKGLAFINILSLSVGMACFSLLLLYAFNEFHYDRFHPDSNRLFRVCRWSEYLSAGDSKGDPYLPVPLGPALQADFPEVEQVARFREEWGESFVRINGVVSRLGITCADPQFLEMMHFPLKYGSTSTALMELNSIVLTEATALRLFGEGNPVGRTLEIKFETEFEPFTVTAIAENMPCNTSIRFDALGNFGKLLSSPRMAKRKTSWNHSAYETFVKLRSGSNLPNDPARLLQFRQKYYPAEEQELRQSGQWTGVGAPVTYHLQPLTSMHTETSVAGGQVPPIDTKGIWILLAIATGILVVAGINFTTLAIGRSAGRAREVGIRKVMGSGKKQLMGQFLLESLFLTGISAVFGLLLANLLLPDFNRLADRELVFSFRQFPELSWMLGGMVILSGVLAGSYPALVLSDFRPAEILRNKIRLGGSNFFTRSLVIGQFVLSIGLMASTVVILKQLDFMRSKNPGFDRENVVVVDASDVDSKRIFPLFQQAATARTEVLGVSGAELGLGAEQGWSRSAWKDQGVNREVYEYFVDDKFLDVLKLPLLAGRNFQPGVTEDTVRSVVINESMMHTFGWTLETAIGQPLNGYYEDASQPLPVVIGVVRDFNFLSLRETIKPQMFHQFSGYVPFKYFVRLRPGDPASALAALATDWKKAEPLLPFKYSFLDENLDRFYKSEARLGSIISWAGGIAVFLGCLGLFGLTALAVANRRKEVGIRKVLGASVQGIVGLLARDFLKLVGIAMLIATPLAYYFMQHWLADFAHRIDLQWWMFALSGVAALAIAFLTVSVQSVKAALANPVDSLKNE